MGLDWEVIVTEGGHPTEAQPDGKDHYKAASSDLSESPDCQHYHHGQTIVCVTSAPPCFGGYRTPAKFHAL